MPKKRKKGKWLARDPNTFLSHPCTAIFPPFFFALWRMHFLSCCPSLLPECTGQWEARNGSGLSGENRPLAACGAVVCSRDKAGDVACAWRSSPSACAVVPRGKRPGTMGQPLHREGGRERGSERGGGKKLALPPSNCYC